MISVIIPTYNRGRCLSRSIDSVLRQTYSDMEVIVVDDGSTDDTKSVVEAYEDLRVRYVFQERSGACAARNRGIDEARGEYIAFQDSDDTWCEDKLEIQLHALLEKDADIVFSGFRKTTEGSDEFEFFPPDAWKPIGRLTICNLLPGNICSTQTLLMKKECLMDERFDVMMPRLQDWELMLRLVPKWRTYYVDGYLSTIYVQSDSISTDEKAYTTALEKIIWTISEDCSRQYKTLSQNKAELGQTEADLEKTKSILKQKEAELDQAEADLKLMSAELAHYKEHYLAAIGQREALKTEVFQLQLSYDEVTNSTCWKSTKPIRSFLNHLKAFMHRHKSTELLYRGMRYLWGNGPSKTCKKWFIIFRILPKERAN